MNQRRLDKRRRASVLLELLIAAVAGTVGALWFFGIILAQAQVKEAPNFDGMVAVPVSARAIPAYTRLTREHLYDPAIGNFKVVYFPPDELNPELVTRIDKLLGRVLSHDKPTGYAFRAKDFLPEGTRPGVVAGISPGKRALNLDADKIKGIQPLKAGDHFDLLSSLPIDDKRNPAAGSLLAPGLRQDPPPKHALVQALVQNAVIVSPVTSRQIPTSQAQGRGPAPTKLVHEVVIALEPREIAGLTGALALNAEIMCVVRSGRPDDPGESSLTPGTTPPKRRFVEVIVGNKRQMVEFPLPPDEGTEPESPPAPPAKMPLSKDDAAKAGEDVKKKP